MEYDATEFSLYADAANVEMSDMNLSVYNQSTIIREALEMFFFSVSCEKPTDVYPPNVYVKRLNRF